MRILVATGSSGGHIFPALSFIEALVAKYADTDVHLVLPKKNILQSTKNILYRVSYISIPVFKRGAILDNLKGALELFNAHLAAISIIFKFKPDIVIGFGSLSTLPVVLCAWFFRVTTVIHEQNVSPGRANKFLARICDKVAISFLETRGYFKCSDKKIAYTGNPIRQSLVKIDKKQGLDFFGFDQGLFTCLVLGGSQGSHRINQEFLEFIQVPQMRDKIQVIHLTGPSDYSRIERKYASMGIKYKCFSFLEHMEYAYSGCDLVLSRAGASTIAEIIRFQVPAMLVPYPYAGLHQLSNARILEERGCAVVIEDGQFCSAGLKQALVPLMDNRQKLLDMRSGYAGYLEFSAAERLVDTVIAAGQ